MDENLREILSAGLAAADPKEAVLRSVRLEGDSILTGDARAIASVYAAVIREVLESGNPAPPPCAVVSGGEATVSVRGNVVHSMSGSASPRMPSTGVAAPKAPAFVMGLGFGGFVDGIVLHQILQWHHLLSSEGNYTKTTLRGLEDNMLADGVYLAYVRPAPEERPGELLEVSELNGGRRVRE